MDECLPGLLNHICLTQEMRVEAKSARQRFGETSISTCPPPRHQSFGARKLSKPKLEAVFLDQRLEDLMAALTSVSRETKSRVEHRPQPALQY
jgi:hypothetical protein